LRSFLVRGPFLTLTGGAPSGRAGLVRLSRFGLAAIADNRAEPADVVLGGNLKHGLSHDLDTVCYAGSSCDQVTFSARAPLISAANQDLSAARPQHLVALVDVHRVDLAVE
jgi:hypothetical protein